MVTIDTSFDTICLSADLPDTVQFSIQDNASAMVSIAIAGGTTIFSTTLYANSGRMTLNDIRSIIENTLTAQRRNCANFSLMVDDSDSVATRSLYVVMSQLMIEDAATFLEKNFLSTRRTFKIHRYGKQLLSWTCPDNASEKYYIDALLLPPDSPKTKVRRWNETTRQNTIGNTYSSLIDVQTITEHFASMGKVLAFTVHRGERSATFYVTEETPNAVFSFYNAFNVVEYAELQCVTATKQKVERSEANILRKRVFYNQSTDFNHEVETAALLYSEAHWLNQMISSHHVEVLVATNSFKQVLITESDAEISDANDKQNRIKFTWKFADNTQYFTPEYPTQVFSPEYNPQYQ